MNNQAKQIEKAIRNVASGAVYDAGSVLLADSINYIPTWVGNLRNETEIRKNGNSVELVSGTGDSKKYAAYQYWLNLRHDIHGGVYSPISDIAGGAGEIGSKSKYQRGYRLGIETNTLTRRKSKWFHRASSDPNTKRKMRATFINSLRNKM